VYGGERALKTIMDMDPKDIRNAIKSGDVTVSVYGLGWMGLPIACLFAEAGADVIGVDVNRYVVETVNSGRSHIEEPKLQKLVKKHVRAKKLVATDDVGGAAFKSDVIIIVVPTLIDRRKAPDYSAVRKVCKGIGLKLRKGCLVIFESTAGPGTTEGLVKKRIERASGLKAASDFGLAYSPIRASSGSVLRDIQSYPRVVAGLNERSLKAASAVLSTIVRERIIEIQDIKTAEAVKLFENVYRDVNIALANELAIFCEKAGINFEDAKRMANTQPFSHIHTSSIGVGGHCIPVNPYFLIEEAEGVGVKFVLPKAARKINDKMPRHAVDLIINGLRARRKTLRRSKIAVLGVSYKANVKEARASPVHQVIRRLVKKGAKVVVYDPYFSADEIKEMGYNAAGNLWRAIDNVDCVFFAVAHSKFKDLEIDEIGRFVKKPVVIVDGCHILNFKDVKRKWVIYREIGRGRI
jgi:nucleotide sugar dehydrogenase